MRPSLLTLSALGCGLVASHALAAAPAQKVLLIGDSHTVGAFGDALRTTISAKRYAVAGSQASDWLKKVICPANRSCPFTYGYANPSKSFTGRLPSNFPGLKGLLAETTPTKVVIALGTNDAVARCKSGDLSAATSLAAQARAGGRACVWIGPPTYTRGRIYTICGQGYNTFVNKLKAAVSQAGCRFVDSRQIKNPKTGRPVEADGGDKVHFSSGLGGTWGREAGRLAK